MKEDGKFMGSLRAACFFLMSVPVLAWGDLTVDQKGDLEAIERKLQRIEDEIGQQSPQNINLSLSEAREWIDELKENAKLADSDPLLVRLNKRLSDLKGRSEGAVKESMELEKKKAAPIDKSKREKLDELLKIEVDLKKVSFKRDVAPIIADSCLGCHNAARKAGKFDASTYDSFMTQIEAGKPDDSHALNLIVGKAEPRMPRGNRGFPADWVNIWTTWIKQGAEFDGTNKKAPITEYMIDADAKRREKIAQLSPGELDSLHQLAADQQMLIVKPKLPVNSVETPNFILRTTLNERDAEYVSVLAEAIIEDAGPRFGKEAGDVIWPGRLGLIVFKDRYDYVAFARQIDNYSPEESEFGHIRLRPEFSYVVMTTQDSESSIDLLVAQQVLAAFFQTLGKGKMPSWAVYGVSRAEAVTWDRGGAAPVKKELHQAAKLMKEKEWPASLFDGKIPWVETAPLSASLFTYLAAENRKRVTDFEARLAEGVMPAEALKGVYNTDEKGLREQWYPWIMRKFGRGK